MWPNVLREATRVTERETKVRRVHTDSSFLRCRDLRTASLDSGGRWRRGVRRGRSGPHVGRSLAPASVCFYVYDDGLRPLLRRRSRTVGLTVEPVAPRPLLTTRHLPSTLSVYFSNTHLPRGVPVTVRFYRGSPIELTRRSRETVDPESEVSTGRRAKGVFHLGNLKDQPFGQKLPTKEPRRLITLRL